MFLYLAVNKYKHLLESWSGNGHQTTSASGSVASLEHTSYIHLDTGPQFAFDFNNEARRFLKYEVLRLLLWPSDILQLYSICSPLVYLGEITDTLLFTNMLSSGLVMYT